MEDTIQDEDIYVVQRPSNVFPIIIINSILQLQLTKLLRKKLTKSDYAYGTILPAFWGTLWFFLEDHFHTGHHFKSYRNKYFNNNPILGKWFDHL